MPITHVLMNRSATAVVLFSYLINLMILNVITHNLQKFYIMYIYIYISTHACIFYLCKYKQKLKRIYMFQNIFISQLSMTGRRRPSRI